ncbi:MAG: hypothetical protein CMP36_01840 [Rickettsiales bacterium]|nr:hypothetical protein [Rickettsiales bacterium]OUV81433.1 MAG: hypothetical protein CBC91_02340 [Rickettsiales bacterium TMED131]|tara:strand:- start:776 stop:1201 length:426 start_codon:yes stop_codon:yes gene_type:complete
MKTELKYFKSLHQLGSFLKENRRKQGLKIDDASKILLIKKSILKSFEDGDIEISNNSHFKGFLNSYIKFLNLEKTCKFEFTNNNKLSSLDKPNFQLEAPETKNTKYSSIIILLSLIVIGFIYLFWNKNTYLNLYLIGTSIN